MSNIAQYFLEAELTLAAYSSLTANMPQEAYVTALQQGGMGMSILEAQQFAKSWRVVEQYTDAASGLSVTVFAPTSNPSQRYVAIRGTEPAGTDLTADGLLALGLPSSLNPQFVALKTQIDVWIDDGTLSGSFTVTGHSLGGYLAAAVKQIYSQVTDAFLFNAPGVGGLFGNLADAFASALGLSGISSDNIWNVRGSEGFPIISGLGYQLGTTVSIQTEAADNPLNNHSIVILTDALAIQSLYSQLDPTLSQDQLNALVDASGATNSQTLEGALDALRKLLLGPTTRETPTGDRNTLYAHLYALQGSAAFNAMVGTAHLTLLTGMSAGDIAAMAEVDDAQGLVTRYALVALNPFALTGADYGAFNSDGALALYDPATEMGNLTEQYLTDRAALLERKLWFSTEDKNPVDPSVVFDSNNPPFQNESAYYEDVATGYKIQQGGLFPNTHHYFFGGDGADSHTGSSVEDHLYGGRGNDRFVGGGGDDYLEGGQGDDYLDGGLGDDVLIGGEGMDTYVIQGHDIIIDQGRNVIIYNDETISGVFKSDGSGSTFVADDGRTLSFHSPGRLVLSDEDSITFQNQTGAEAFAGNDFGIFLDDRQAPVTTTNLAGTAGQDFLSGSGNNDLIQGHAGIDYLSGGAGDDVIEGGEGNDVIAGGAKSDNDTLYGGDGDDLILGDGALAMASGDSAYLTQNNLLTGIQTAIDANGFMSYSYAQPANLSVGTAYGPGGDDTIYAGAGNDVVHAGGSRDFVDGGEGADMLSGDGGDDILLGQGGNDIILGDAINDGTTYGDDILVGGDGNDRLWGAGGNDYLLGGDGDDYLHGDGNLDTAHDGNDVLDGGGYLIRELNDDNEWRLAA